MDASISTVNREAIPTLLQAATIRLVISPSYTHKHILQLSMHKALTTMSCINPRAKRILTSVSWLTFPPRQTGCSAPSSTSPQFCTNPHSLREGGVLFRGRKKGICFFPFFSQHNQHLIKGIATYWKSKFPLILSFRFPQFNTQHLQSTSPQLEHCYTPVQAGPLSEICNTTTQAYSDFWKELPF